MSTTNVAVENSTESQSRSVEPGRFERALTDPMTVERTADRFYHVTTESGTYDVDLRTGACSCPDAEYRGDRYVCKHAIRAALASVVAEGSSRTALVARVLGATAGLECQHDGRQCNGPLAPTDYGAIPCPGCVDATRSEGTDEYDAWKVVVDRQRSGGRR